jgi:hypothetical protein
MKKSTMVTLGAALILPALLLSVVNLNSKVAAQEPKIDIEKLKQILNETRMALEANDDPGAMTQLDLADALLNGNMTSGSNMTNTTAIVTG